jgi:hypothetical protein
MIAAGFALQLRWCLHHGLQLKDEGTRHQAGDTSD